MSAPRRSNLTIGSAAYQEAALQEAAFWENVAKGEIDLSVAAWRDTALSSAVSGDLLEQALDLVVARGAKVLELACGSGGVTIRLAQRGCQADGVDLSEGLIALGREQIEALTKKEQLPGSAQLFTGDLNCMCLEPSSYDVVFANAALHHILDLEHLIGQVHSALKPGGSLICLDHMEATRPALLLRYLLLLLLPTEIPYRRKPRHTFKRIMARVYPRLRPQKQTPAAFALPPHSPFEDISGSEAIDLIRGRFQIETYQTYLAFADVVAGHLRLGLPGRNLAMARVLRRLDDLLIRRCGLRGQTYFLVARKERPATPAG